ncbi:HotDog domain-containing protein [Durotheca rogersii]|uniref:HotDog domain-containing protein n=1 Tax=Durotheca rogersii TaxID=419775 RepID=UPI00221EA271|nr:HotDog domain-containing protein [Durotheca rogersii]KAI5868507.1 HotDog domain-containing protein [Durotheca rogersii]
MSPSSSSSPAARPGRGPAVRPHSAPTQHNQSVADPVAHFRAIPWCAALLADPAVLEVVVPDRRPLPSGESNFVRRTVNSATTVRACVTFFRALDDRPGQAAPEAAPARPLSASAPLLAGGGPTDGEDPRNPFLLLSALVDLGPDCSGFAGTLHGGLCGVLMDEVMGTAANFQAENGAYTLSFTTRFRRAVATPQVVLARGRVVRRDRRKIWVRGTLEDKDGRILAEGEGLWLSMDRDIGRSQL